VSATGARVVVLRDTLYLPEQPVACLRAHPKEEQKCVWRRDAVLRQIRYPFANFDQVEGDVTVVDVDDKIRDATLCPLVRDGTVIMFDWANLSRDIRQDARADLRGSHERERRPLVGQAESDG